MTRSVQYYWHRLLAVDPSLKEKRYQVIDLARISKLTEQTSLPFWRVRQALFVNVFLKKWRLMLIMDPANGCSEAERYKALITYQATQVTKGIRQLLPKPIPKPSPIIATKPKPFTRSTRRPVPIDWSRYRFDDVIKRK